MVRFVITLDDVLSFIFILLNNLNGIGGALRDSEDRPIQMAFSFSRRTRPHSWLARSLFRSHSRLRAVAASSWRVRVVLLMTWFTIFTPVDICANAYIMTIPKYLWIV